MGQIASKIGSAGQKVFGTMGDTAEDDDMTGGQLFARKAIKGALAGAGQGLQQMDGGQPPPVNFNQLMTPTPRRKPLTQPGQAPPGNSALYGD